MKPLLLLFVCGLTAAERPDWERHLKSLDATFVLLDARTGQYLRHEPARVAQPDPQCPVSANEQIAALQRIHNLTATDSGPGWRLSATAGSCGNQGSLTNLWYIGYVEKGPNTHYFALRIGTTDPEALSAELAPTARAILNDLGLTTPSPGEAMLQRTCTVCHNLDGIRQRHLTREDWDLELGKMTTMGAKIQNREALLNYLVKAYGK